MFRKALVLAAGQGTRLGAATREIPKPMLRVRGQPVLERHVEQLAAAGVTALWINIHHQGQVIEDHFGDGQPWGIRIHYSRETTLLGTSGALKKLEQEFAASPFFVVYGDNVGSCDYAALAQTHRPGTLLTVALCHQDDVSHSGIAELDEDGRMLRFVEKPSPDEAFSHWVNAGFYAASPELLPLLPAGVSDFGRDVIPRLLAEGRPVRGYCLPVPVEGIDTPEMLASAGVLRVAVIGAGRMGAKRAAVARRAGGRVEWVVDPQTELAAKIAGGARVAAEWKEAIEDPQVDCVIVSTPNHLLAPISLAAVEARKHVLVEKPAARNAAELEPVVELAGRNRVVCKAGFNYRFHPAIHRAHQLLHGGEIGKLLHLVARHGHGGRLGLEKEWRADPQIAGGGQLLDQGVHLLDLCRWFAGAEFTSVQAVVATEFWGIAPLEDTAFCLLRTASGVTASVLVSLVEWKNKFQFEAVGERGSLLVEGLGGSYGPERLTTIRRPEQFGVPQIETREFSNPEQCWADEWAEFTAALQEGRRPLGDVSDSLAVLRLVEDCYRAGRKFQLPLEAAARIGGYRVGSKIIMLKPAVFLDRDGVLVRPLIRDNLAYAPLRREDFELLAGGAEAVAALRAAGFVVVVITNQPEVRRGTLDPALLEEFHQRLRAAIPVDDILTCCHDDRDACLCRKPKPGMVLEAARRHGLDLARSFLVGDTDKDLGAAQAAGLPFVLIDAPYNTHLEVPLRVPDVAAAARAILTR